MYSIIELGITPNTIHACHYNLLVKMCTEGQGNKQFAIINTVTRKHLNYLVCYTMKLFMKTVCKRVTLTDEQETTFSIYLEKRKSPRL
jgi:hypothetical protein